MIPPSVSANQQPALLGVYETRLDGKKRIVIRNPQYTYYEVREFSDGRIELFPRILISPEEMERTISRRTLQMLDGSMQNLTTGIASTVVDTQELLAHLSEEDRKEIEEMQKSQQLPSAIADISEHSQGQV